MQYRVECETDTGEQKLVDVPSLAAFAESDRHCQDGEFQLTFLDPAPASKCEAA